VIRCRLKWFVSRRRICERSAVAVNATRATCCSGPLRTMGNSFTFVVRELLSPSARQLPRVHLFWYTRAHVSSHFFAATISKRSFKQQVGDWPPLGAYVKSGYGCDQIEHNNLPSPQVCWRAQKKSHKNRTTVFGRMLPNYTGLG